MRVMIVGGALLALLNVSAKATECSSGRDDLISVEQWTGREAEYGGVRVSLDLRNQTGHDIRMLRGGIRFVDPFGELITNLELDPDTRIAEGQTITQVGVYRVARLARVNPEDVKTTVCLEGLVRADGTVEDYR